MTPDIREILEEYKKMIHGSEFDFHRQIQSLKEHEESMDRAKEITRIAIDSAYKKWFIRILGIDG